jgi:hypothetical protein
MVERRIDQSSPLAVHMGTSWSELPGHHRALGGREPYGTSGEQPDVEPSEAEPSDAEVIAAPWTTLRRSR